MIKWSPTWEKFPHFPGFFWPTSLNPMTLEPRHLLYPAGFSWPGRVWEQLNRLFFFSSIGDLFAELLTHWMTTLKNITRYANCRPVSLLIVTWGSVRSGRRWSQVSKTFGKSTQANVFERINGLHYQNKCLTPRLLEGFDRNYFPLAPRFAF